MSTRHPSWLLVSGLIATATATGTGTGCTHTSVVETSTTTTTSAAVDTPVNPQAINAIAGTRCKRESRCDNIGADRRYASYDGCMVKIQSEGVKALNAATCPRGLDSAEVNGCLADIRDERCESVLDTIDRLPRCRARAICRP